VPAGVEREGARLDTPGRMWLHSWPLSWECLFPYQCEVVVVFFFDCSSYRSCSRGAAGRGGMDLSIGRWGAGCGRMPLDWRSQLPAEDAIVCGGGVAVAKGMERASEGRYVAHQPTFSLLGVFFFLTAEA
jgi:hypothetical protein